MNGNYVQVQGGQNPLFQQMGAPDGQGLVAMPYEGPEDRRVAVGLLPDPDVEARRQLLRAVLAGNPERVGPTMIPLIQIGDTPLFADMCALEGSNVTPMPYKSTEERIWGPEQRILPGSVEDLLK